MDTRSINPHELLQATFDHPHSAELHPNVKVLTRVYQAIRSGDLTVNGLPPDKNYYLGEYLIHGGRIRFDLSQLSKENRQLFFDYIKGDATFYHRKYATHRRGAVDPDGNIAEEKSGLWGAFIDLLTREHHSKHLYINLPIGGEGREEKGGIVAADGQWGHMYIYDDHKNGFMMIGIEQSGPGQRNLRTGKGHSKLGRAGELTAFMAKSIDDRSLHEEQRTTQDKCSISTTVKYNWACVKVTVNNLEEILGETLLFDKEHINLFKKSLNTPHKHSVLMKKEKRETLMTQWQQLFEKMNSVSTWACLGGIILASINFTLVISKFPVGIAQAINALMVGMGVETVFCASLLMASTGLILGAIVGGGFRLIQANNAKTAWVEAYTEALKGTKEIAKVPVNPKQIFTNGRDQPSPTKVASFIPMRGSSLLTASGVTLFAGEEPRTNVNSFLLRDESKALNKVWKNSFSSL